MQKTAKAEALGNRIDGLSNTVTTQNAIISFLTDAINLASRTGQLSNDELRELKLVRVTIQSRCNDTSLRLLQMKDQLKVELGQLNMFEI